MTGTFMRKTSGAYIPPEKYPAIHDAVLQACDGLDGVKDGVLENPLACRFDPKVLQCKAGEDTVSCLTAPQVQTAKMIYAAAKDPKTGRVLTGGLMPGTELQWGTLYSPTGYGNAIEAMKYIAMKDPNWDLAQFNASTDVEKAQKADPESILKSENPNIKAFFDRGGKLLMYQGFADPQVTSDNAIRYHQMVLDKVGKQAEGKSITLFMIPGMYHCQGGPGTDTWDKAAALDAWVTSGKAPDRIVASHLTDGKPDLALGVHLLSDPVQVAHYKVMQPALLAGCGTSGCHVGPSAKGGNFVLFQGDQAAQVYTNFLTLQTFTKAIDKTPMSMVDRQNPDSSLLLEYMLPPDVAKVPHPPTVPAYKGTVKTKSDVRFARVAQWIHDFSGIQPAYGIDLTTEAQKK